MDQGNEMNEEIENTQEPGEAPEVTAGEESTPVDADSDLPKENPEEDSTTDDPEAQNRLDRIVESVLFAAGTPLSLRKLHELLDGPSTKEVQASLTRLKEIFAPGQRGIQLQEVAGGYQLRTARENAEWVRGLFREKPTRLGRATLETLAVIAYRQPVTKADIELIRGVDVDGTLTTLLTRKLIKIAGRKEAVGRPLLYGTSSEFLEIFGLKDLNDLPSLKELGPGPDGDYSEAPAIEGSESLQATDGATDSTDTPAEATADFARPSGADVFGEVLGEGQDGGIEGDTADLEAAAELGEGDWSGDEGGSDGEASEDSESIGSDVAASRGGTDPRGSGEGERQDGDDPGDEGEPKDRSHHD